MSAVNTANHDKRVLWAILLSVAIVGTTMSMSLQLLSLVMEMRGYNTALIGMHASMTAVAILTVGPYVPKLMARYSSLILIYVGIALLALSLLALAHTENLVLWFALRYVLGLGICLVWTISETCINSIGTDENRGKILGMYGASFAAGFAVGPIVLNIIGAEGVLPFYVAMAIVLVSAIPLYLLGEIKIDFTGHDQHRFWRVAKKFPALFVVGICAGFVEVAAYTLLHIYGLHIGLPLQEAMYMLSVFVIGSVALQPLVGWSADNFSIKHLIMIVTMLCTIIAVALPFVISDNLLLWPMVFVWGGVSIGIYTVGVIGIGKYFQGKELAAANSGFIMMYAIGTLTGPSIAGLAMQISDPQGYVWSLAMCSFLCFCFVWLRGANSVK